MSDIKHRLNQELEQITFQKKVERGTTLTEEDVHIVFKVLKDHDRELKPVLDIMEILVARLVKEDYLLMEKYIGEVLRYYQILPNDDFIQCRHKLFFTESKQLVKKSFFGPAAIEKVKDELAIHNIFKKI